MDYYQMTAPCGLDCFNCHFYLARKDKEAMGTVKKLARSKFSNCYLLVSLVI